MGSGIEIDDTPMIDDLPNDPMLRAKMCLDKVKADYDYARANGIRDISHIDWEYYMPGFDISGEQVIEYCKSLPRLAYTLSKCVICGNDWYDWKDQNWRGKSGLDFVRNMGEPHPSGNGCSITWVDYISTFCNHDKTEFYGTCFITYDQGKDGLYELARQFDIDKEEFQVRYNYGYYRNGNRNDLEWWKYDPKRREADIVVLKKLDDDRLIFAPIEEVKEEIARLMVLV